MKVISPASDTVLNILKSFKRTGECNRFIKFCVEAPIEGGVLLFHLLTRELILLTNEEYQNFDHVDYLKQNWFLLPQSFNDKECADFVKFFLNTRMKKSSDIVTYTVFPTTDCNARCFYCFELGRSRIPMTREIAVKTAQYMKDHCGGKTVRIRWFGGEPLMNAEAIDTICNTLHAEGVDFRSGMVSNGYLFNDSIINKAADCWNLKRVQITLDGTESIYNKVKAYIYKEGNPYHIVLNNIEKLLNASINVVIRMNMDLHNAEDLLLLAKELSDRFAGTKGLEVYAHHLFKDGVPMAIMHTEDEWIARDEAMRKIEETLTKSGLASTQGILKKFKTNHCMADSGSAVTILPDGSIGLCEHHSENEFIGHIDNDEFNQDVVASWKERVPEIHECADCFYFPECIKLKKCSNASVCYPQYRTNTLRKTQQRMINEYYKWKNGVKSEELDDLLEE